MDVKFEIIPYFPLSVFLLPGEDIPLNIFEPRYKQLVEDARNTGITFAIPFVIGEDIQEYGCEVRLKEVLAENPRSRMVITVESLSLVKILSFKNQLSGKLYAGGAVRRLAPSGRLESRELKDLIENYADRFDPGFLRHCRESGITYHDVIKALNLPSEEKYRFILMDKPAQKERYVSGQIRYLMMIRKQEKQLGDDFGLN